MRKFAVPDPVARRQVEAALRGVGSATTRPEQSCEYRLDLTRGGDQIVVKQYTNGTLFITASRPSALLDASISAIEGAIGAGRSVAVGSTLKRAVDPDLTRPFPTPWVGSDEAGKGDYFGPLVVAAVWVDDQRLALLEAIGVRDSKVVRDTEIDGLATAIREISGTGAVTVVISPARYNVIQKEMAGQGRNLNDLVAWGHAQAITGVRQHHAATRAIVDQFANPRHLDAALARHGGEPLTVLHAPRAEANTAVAAASILARAGFLGWFTTLARRWGMTLPLGASVAVIGAARAFVDRHGAEALPEVAKIHFKTTESVLRSPRITERSAVTTSP